MKAQKIWISILNQVCLMIWYQEVQKDERNIVDSWKMIAISKLWHAMVWRKNQGLGPVLVIVGGGQTMFFRPNFPYLFNKGSAQYNP